MKSHALAKKLLLRPDLPVVIEDTRLKVWVEADGNIEIVEHPYKVGAKAVRIA